LKAGQGSSAGTDLRVDGSAEVRFPVLILFGPTASGKTAILRKIFNSLRGLSCPLLGDFQGAEIISADSMQVYKGMDIGTAKPSKKEQADLPHHLIDICDPSQQFNAGDFVRLADNACAQIASRGRLPVISGGTGFYLKNFILGLSEAPPSDKTIREQLKNELREKGINALISELASCDPVSAGRIHINDEYRLLRALEVFRFSGRPLSSFEVNSQKRCPSSGAQQSKSAQTRGDYNFVIIGLSRPREELYKRINARCEEMFRQGLPEEVRSLFEAGYTPDDPGMRAIGYREFFVEQTDIDQTDNDQTDTENDSASIESNRKRWRLSNDLNGVKALIAQNSRRYAKRQITFFAGIPNVKWINVGDNEDETAEIIKKEIFTTNHTNQYKL